MDTTVIATEEDLESILDFGDNASNVVPAIEKLSPPESPQYNTSNLQSQFETIRNTRNLGDFFHLPPTPNNFVFMLISNKKDELKYLNYLRHLFTPLNQADCILRETCKKLLIQLNLFKLEPIVASYMQWESAYLNGTNLLGVNHACFLLKVLKSQFENNSSKLLSAITSINSGAIINFINVSDEIKSLTKLNLYIPKGLVISCLENLVDNTIRRYVRLIDRVEIAKDLNITQEGDYPKITIYINPNVEKNKSTIMSFCEDIAEETQRIISTKYHKPNLKKYSFPISRHASITQGFKLYKEYLASLCIIDDLYDADTGYAYLKGSFLNFKG